MCELHLYEARPSLDSYQGDPHCCAECTCMYVNIDYCSPKSDVHVRTCTKSYSNADVHVCTCTKSYSNADVHVCTCTKSYSNADVHVCTCTKSYSNADVQCMYMY